MWKLSLAGLLAFLVVVTGCATQKGATVTEGDNGEEIATGIPLAPDFRIADIPVPAGFAFDRDSSFVFQNAAIEVGKIQYVGKEEITDVAQFYVDEMPRYEWTLLNVSEHRTISLTFDKPQKSCLVLLSPKVRGTLVQISFYPKQRAPMAEEQQY